jgi:hypothetical protein
VCRKSTAPKENIEPPRNAAGDLLHEIEIQTTWQTLLDDAPQGLEAKQIEDHEAWLVEDLLSHSELNVLLKAAESNGFGSTEFSKAYRGNLRLQASDKGLADAMWLRLKPLLPEVVEFDGKMWHAIGLNDRWRLAKYYPGDRFMRHLDGVNKPSSTEQSMFTVNIYANEEFEGGTTRFFFKDEHTADVIVTPKTGLCLLFRQNPGQSYYHDGEEVKSGVKYLIRSDVMYSTQE